MRFLDAIVDSVVPGGRSQRMNLADAYFADANPLNQFTSFSVGGQTYTVPVQTTMPGQKAEAVANSFEGFVAGGLMANSVIFSLTAVRLRVFSEARFQYQRFNKGRPGELYGDKSLVILEKPWPGGVTGDLLALMLLHADFAGNAYVTKIRDQLVCMRPDWVEIMLADRRYVDAGGLSGTVGMEKVGYNFYQGGKSSGVRPISFLAEEVAHFAPLPDPLAWYRGISWLTPVVREVQADGAATSHKLKFFENAATPNLAVSLKEITDPTQFEDFVAKMDEAHRGWQNAYKTLYLGAGADVTLIGANFKDADFSNVVGKGETRMASAAGVPPVVAGLSEGLQGSSLNAGNFGQARRQFADTTMSALWRNVSGSLNVLVAPPDPASRLWYDTRDIPFLRQDQTDLATIQQQRSQAIRELYMAGFTPDSIVAAVMADDLSLLVHTGAYSIQVQTPGTTNVKLPSTVDEPPNNPEGTTDSPPQTPAGPAPAAPAAPQAGKAASGRHSAFDDDEDTRARTNARTGGKRAVTYERDEMGRVVRAVEEDVEP